MKTPKTIVILPDGNLSCLDAEGNQILTESQQKNMILLFIEYLDSLGIDPSQITSLGSYLTGETTKIHIHKTHTGWRYGVFYPDLKDKK